jgi:lambda family phage tail tape measure protein
MPKAGSRAGFDITSAAEENRKQIERQIELAGLLSDSFLGAFRDIASGTETASDAFKKMSIAIVEHILEILIWKPLIESLTNALSPTAVGGNLMGGLLGNLFPAANGAAINNGNVVPFAYGGVVNSPTMFGMSGGRTGLMGEAGPEAIMPLKRGPNGKLGVEGGGNVTVNQSFNFAANGDESVKKIIAEAAPGIAKMTEAQIVNSRQRGGQMRRVFS